MLAKTALLIVSNPKQIGKILPSIRNKVQNTLYIQLLSALGEPLGNFYTNIFTTWPKYSQTIYGIYSQAAAHCQNLDVRVLLSGLKYKSTQKIQTNRIVDLVIFDKLHTQNEIDHFLAAKIGNINTNCSVITLDSGPFQPMDAESAENLVFKHTVLGGTFDRLHLAHKLLLSEAALRSSHRVTVGVTEESMLKTKVLWEMIEDIETRLMNVREFLTDVCPELGVDVVPISDPFGPAIVDNSMEMIVVSEETVRGGEKINEIRSSNQLNKLEIVTVRLIDEPYPHPVEETKISSSTGRMRLLGTLLKPTSDDAALPAKPYRIGLTGGVASGKSGVAKWMSLYPNTEIISCDLIGHNVYKKGKPCHAKLVEHFGQEIVGDDGEINRKNLGSIVFNNAAKLQQLNELVWPAIAEEVEELIKNSKSEVIVIEAAVLLTAGWEKFCHEVWTTLIPTEEAVKRLKSRNNLNEEQALARIKSQPDNKFYVQRANVVLCPLWEVEYTKQQVDRAWNLLQERIGV